MQAADSPDYRISAFAACGGDTENSEAQRLLAAVLQNLGLMVLRSSAGLERSLCEIPRGCEELTGYASEEFEPLGKFGLMQLLHPHDLPALRQEFAEISARGGAYQIEYRIIRKDGRERWVRETGQVMSGAGGERLLESVVEDISECMAMRARLADVELRYRSVFDNPLVGMYQTSEGGQYIAANQTLARLYGYDTPGKMIAGFSNIARELYVDPHRRDEFKLLMASQGFVTDFESEVFQQDGQRIWITEHARAVYSADGSLLYYAGTVEDISERRRYQEQLEFQANRDALTGLPNRNLLKDRLDQAMLHARRAGTTVAIAFIDLDNFKVINDSLGHATGDEMLLEMALRLKNCVRQSDTVARYGGDEFVVIMESQTSLAETSGAMQRIHASILKPLQLSGHELRVSCSIGVAMFPDDGDDLETLLRHADVAMYHAKSEGKAQYQYYTAQLNAAVTERLSLESGLRRALEQDELSVVFQPKLDAHGEVKGFEALVRWKCEEYGQVEPSRFIPLAEETGLIVPLTEFVLRRACSEAMGWSKDCSVAVNLSAAQLRDGELPSIISRILSETGLPPARLELEITESWLACNQERTVRILDDIKALGCSIAIDDFGTGYSSLAYLKRFPVDVLKIDRSFVSELTHTEDSRAIPRAIISMGHSLGMRVVAEGVETIGQFEFLAGAGCHEFQGYYFSRPMHSDHVEGFLVSMRTPDGTIPIQ